MKKSFALIIVSLLLMTNLAAQQFVSTAPQNRNVLLEDFTGVNCPYCPLGHAVANQLSGAYPDRVWSVNIHTGKYASTSYPNFITSDGDAIGSGFYITAYPQGVVNRSTDNALSRNDWGAHTNQQLEQKAECNIAGHVIIDHLSRTAEITVEVYYTSNSNESTNYLNVIMLQDEIMGYQASGSDNPSQYENGQYRHMHIFRDAITSTYGDTISPTTKDSFITKKYTYNIPETIGSPNGVNVDIENISFLAFVTEKKQDNISRPILNVNKLTSFIGTNNDIYPYITEVSQYGSSCSNNVQLNVSVANGGLNELTSLEFTTTIDGNTPEVFLWEGSIKSYEVASIQIPVAMTSGTHNVTTKIVKANGTSFESEKTVSITGEEWETVYTSSDSEELTIEIMQDKYGYQITWEIIGSDYSVIASGGPYDYLSGSSATQLNSEVVNIPAGECMKFIIKDSEGNGICCQYGEGYYKILDSKGNIVVDGDGAFGSEASHNILLLKEESIETPDNKTSSIDVYPNPTNGQLYINADDMMNISVINNLGQVVFDKNVDSDNETIDMSQYENGIYMIRIVTEEHVVMKKIIKN